MESMRHHTNISQINFSHSTAHPKIYCTLLKEGSFQRVLSLCHLLPQPTYWLLTTQQIRFNLTLNTPHNLAQIQYTNFSDTMLRNQHLIPLRSDSSLSHIMLVPINVSAPASTLHMECMECSPSEDTLPIQTVHILYSSPTFSRSPTSKYPYTNILDSDL